MKIIREEKEFELTREELFDAYLEQEYLFDVQNIKDNMKDYLNEKEYELLLNNKEFIEEAASELRRNQNKYNMDYENAISEAFKEAKLSYLESND